MASSSKIKVMLSSRCDDMFPRESSTASRLADVRIKMKKEIESVVVLGEHLYEVWVDEEASENAELDAWSECLRQARECDIFIAIYNGNAGWTGQGSSASTGICHAEFLTAYSASPAKTYLVDIFQPNARDAPAKPSDRSFQARIQRE